MALERLQKVMARAGVASRRACEELITAGRVEVNGKVVTELGTKVDAQRDRITVNGQPLAAGADRPIRSYHMLYKPRGYLSVFDDERGRSGLEKLAPSSERLFVVGRLDLDSEGLLLLTNDGDLAQVLSHPRHQHAKVYLVLVDHHPGTDALARLQHGIDLEGGKTAPSTWRVLDEAPKVQPAPEGTPNQGVWLKVVLREGRKRQIRRMAMAVGLEVRRLIRVQLGPLVLDNKLAPGESRRLTRQEVQRLRAANRYPGPRRVQQGGRMERVRAGSAGRPASGPTPRPRGKPDDRQRGPRPAGPTRPHTGDSPRSQPDTDARQRSSRPEASTHGHGEDVRRGHSPRKPAPYRRDEPEAQQRNSRPSGSPRTRPDAAPRSPTARSDVPDSRRRGPKPAASSRERSGAAPRSRPAPASGQPSRPSRPPKSKSKRSP